MKTTVTRDSLRAVGFQRGNAKSLAAGNMARQATVHLRKKVLVKQWSLLKASPPQLRSADLSKLRFQQDKHNFLILTKVRQMQQVPRCPEGKTQGYLPPKMKIMLMQASPPQLKSNGLSELGFQRDKHNLLMLTKVRQMQQVPRCPEGKTHGHLPPKMKLFPERPLASNYQVLSLDCQPPNNASNALQNDLLLSRRIFAVVTVQFAYLQSRCIRR